MLSLWCICMVTAASTTSYRRWRSLSPSPAMTMTTSRGSSSASGAPFPPTHSFTCSPPPTTMSLAPPRPVTCPPGGRPRVCDSPYPLNLKAMLTRSHLFDPIRNMHFQPRRNGGVVDSTEIRAQEGRFFTRFFLFVNIQINEKKMCIYV